MPRLSDIIINRSRRTREHEKESSVMNVTRIALTLSLAAAAFAPAVAQAAPAALEAGSFVSGAHTTAGTATIYKLDDGSRILRLENFSTSNGPKVHVVLADHTVRGNDVENAGSVDLGDLKGNEGNQNYAIPANVDLAKIKAVAIYCERFHVNFGAASLK